MGKWVGAISGIIGGLAVVVTGIWRVGNLIDDLQDARVELASLKGSFHEYQDKMQKRDEIQEEILLNLRIAVASIQAVSTSRTPTRMASHSPVPVTTSARIRRPVRPPVATITPTPPSPEVAALIRSLPPLPPPLVVPENLPTIPPTMRMLAGVSSESRGLALEAAEAHESATADVALERVEILQGQL